MGSINTSTCRFLLRRDDTGSPDSKLLLQGRKSSFLAVSDNDRSPETQTVTRRGSRFRERMVFPLSRTHARAYGELNTSVQLARPRAD